MNGFCIKFCGNSYIGGSNVIEVGWYKNNIVEGNHARVKEETMSTNRAGWFENGRWVSPMIDDPKLKKFKI